jgi:hypothetical protein
VARLSLVHANAKLDSVVGAVTVIRAWLRLEGTQLDFTNKSCTFVRMYRQGNPAAVEHFQRLILTLIGQCVLVLPQVTKRIATCLGMRHVQRGVSRFRRKHAVGDGAVEASVSTAGGGLYVYTRCARTRAV